jgi:hypothetical protein
MKSTGMGVRETSADYNNNKMGSNVAATPIGEWQEV